MTIRVLCNPIFRKFSKKQFSIIRTCSSRHFRKLNRGDAAQSVQKGSSEQSSSLLSYGMLARPFFFTIGFTGCTFAAATIWQHEALIARRKAFFSPPEIFRHHQHHFKRGELRNKLNIWWERLPEGHKVACGIILLNTVVFLAWRSLPAHKASMMKYFTCKPTSRGIPSWPMLLSSFSHFSTLHLATNMYVLWSFAPSMTAHLGKEEFIALYLASGVFSSFASNAYKVATASIAPSLGASGSIMAIIGAMCTTFPDAQLAIVFLPMFAFSAAHALKAIILFDTAGLVLKWKLFDHAAHLGGMAFGLWYIQYGRQLIWRNREGLLKRWELLKNGKL